MTKSELVDAVTQKRDGLSKKDAEIIVDLIFSSMTRALCNDERIEIRGLGSFTAKVREPRQGRNPKTGEPVEVPKKRVPMFNAGKELKERINEGFQRELEERA